MNTEIDPNSKKDESLKNDFKSGQYVYVAIYAFLVICLIVFYG